MLTHNEYSSIKENLMKKFEAAVEKTLIEMGDDIQRISWFSVSDHDSNIYETLGSLEWLKQEYVRSVDETL